MELSSESPPHYVRARVSNACDVCKARKVKCDGRSPCGYCTRHRQPHHCRYSPQRRRGQRTVTRSTHVQPSTPTETQTHTDGTGRRQLANSTPRTSSPVVTAPEEHEETDVPRDARLVRDAQGKLIFIGDCAPLSFFQTVRQLVTSHVDSNAFAPQTSRYSMLENVHPQASTPSGPGSDPPPIQSEALRAIVTSYFVVTTGLIDIFDDNGRLLEELTSWTGQSRPRKEKCDDITSAVYYLVIAIGCQETDEQLSQAYFNAARDRALANLGGNLSVGIIQAFLLISLHMLGACQINGAFLFFGIAVRAAYTVGIHRTEVNSRFGPEIHRQRDRLWKSLRVVDLFLSTSMGRPPATSDVDCTVSYRDRDEEGKEIFDLLNASVQILLLVEVVVVQVYSKRKVSLQLTEGISRELREWSARWLQQLKNTLAASSDQEVGLLNGTCQVLSSYYYAVILISRPFLMYELHQRLSSSSSPLSSERAGLVSGRSKLADACIDAASLMVDPIQDMIGRGLMVRPAPVIVSWLFASSLVLGLGLLGGFGRIIEKYCRFSIQALEYFSKSDGHAVQYSLIAKSLLTTALEYLERKETEERVQRTESSSQLFGLIPREARDDTERSGSPDVHRVKNSQAVSSPVAPVSGEIRHTSMESSSRPAHPWTMQPRFEFDIDSSFLGLSDAFPRTPGASFMGGLFDADTDPSLGALNLFPLLDADGHIDLTHNL